MDKLDGANVVSLMGKAAEASPKKSAPADKDMFARILEQQTGKGSEAQEKGRDAIAAEKKGAEKGSETRASSEMEERLKARLGMKTDITSMANYLYNVTLQNPDSLSMSEKQALRVGEFSSQAVGIKDLQKMLEQRGLNLRNLSFTQLAQLTQRNNRSQVTSFLDQLTSQMRQGRPEAAAMAQAAPAPVKAERDKATKEDEGRKDAQAKEAQSLTQQPSTPPEPQVPLAQAPVPSQGAQQAAEARRQERENVLQQIIQKMEIRNLGNRTELSLKLNPEYLGDLRVQLSTQNGRMEARFETSSKEVRGYIEEGMSVLREKFATQGLNLDRISAHVVEAEDATA